MDNNRVIIAVVLSMLVLVAWSFLFPTPPPPVQQPAPTQQQEAAAPAPGQSAEPLGQVEATPVTPVEGKEVIIDTPLYKAVLSSAGGVLTSFQLHQYQQSIEPGSPDVDLIGPAQVKGPLGVMVDRKATWKIGAWGEPMDEDGQPFEERVLEAGENATVVITGEVEGLRLTRRLTFSADSYLVRESLQVANISQAALQPGIRFTMAAASLTDEDDSYHLTRVAYYDVDGLHEESDTDDLATEGVLVGDGVYWGGVMSNYFLLAITSGDIPVDQEVAPGVGSGFLANYEDSIYRTVVDEPLEPVQAGGETTLQVAYYLGPKSEKALAGAPNGLTAALDFGWFDVIAKPLLIPLNLFHEWTGNYGMAIILLTVVIKIIFWPLSQKSYKSMNEMKKIAPLMQKVREKYKDDRQKQQQELMNLYKTYKVNPASGCLPMLLQIPVFIGLYQALLNSIQLRHATFIEYIPFTDIIWLADLSAKDPFYITPIVMGASMFLQQKMTPMAGDPLQAKIMMFLPLIMTFVFLNFPAGLVVYWLTNNVLSIAQQYWMLRKA